MIVDQKLIDKINKMTDEEFKSGEWKKREETVHRAVNFFINFYTPSKKTLKYSKRKWIKFFGKKTMLLLKK